MTVNRVASTSVDIAHDVNLPAPGQRATAINADIAFDPNMPAPGQRLTAVCVDVAYREPVGGAVLFWTIGQDLLLPPATYQLDEADIESASAIDSNDTTSYVFGIYFAVTEANYRLTEMRYRCPDARADVPWGLWRKTGGDVVDETATWELLTSGTGPAVVAGEWTSIPVGYDLAVGEVYQWVHSQPGNLGYYYAGAYHADDIVVGPLVVGRQNMRWTSGWIDVTAVVGGTHFNSSNYNTTPVVQLAG